jgi:hypothetical protein
VQQGATLLDTHEDGTSALNTYCSYCGVTKPCSAHRLALLNQVRIQACA